MKLSVRHFIWILFPLLATFHSDGQGVSVKPKFEFSIGDEVEEVRLGHVVNPDNNNLSLSDFKGKLVILDFWAFWCTPCLNALPRLDSLQRTFGKRVAIIPIDGNGRGDNAQRAVDFFKKSGFILPTVVEDTLLERFFPHKSIPHEVWIDGSGRIIATTGSDAVTEENIQKVLNGEKVNFSMKLDDIHFDPMKPLFVNGNGGTCDSFIYRSILTAEIPSLAMGGLRQTPIIKEGKMYLRSFQAMNVTLMDLYFAAWNMGRRTMMVNPTRIFIRTGDSLYNPWNYRDLGSIWLRQPLYCYSLDLPNELPDSSFYRRRMLEELNKIFGFNGHIEKRRIETIIMKLSPHFQYARFKPGAGSTQHIRYSDERRSMLDSAINLPFNQLIDIMSRYFYSSPPIFDETNLDSSRVTMKIGIRYNANRASTKAVDFNDWASAFKLNDIIVAQEDRDVDVLVIDIPQWYLTKIHNRN